VVLPSGRYVLVTLDGQTLPWSSVAWTVHADTLEFFPDTTYTTSWVLSTSSTGPLFDTRPRQRYDIVGVDSFWLAPVGEVVDTRSPVVRSGASLLYAEHACCDRPDVL